MHLARLIGFLSALALLSSTDGERHFKPGEVRKAREAKEGDNTLEVVTFVSPPAMLQVSALTFLGLAMTSGIVQEGVVIGISLSLRLASHDTTREIIHHT